MLTKNVVDNIIAGIIATALSTAVGLVLQVFGFSAQVAVTLALFLLCVLLLIFLTVKRFYFSLIRFLILSLLKSILRIKGNDADVRKIAIKKTLIEEVQKGLPQIEQSQDDLITPYPNQLSCETLIQDECRKAKKVKILTIRGERYFSGSRSLLRDIVLSKQGRGFAIEILVLSPESAHITEELAETLGQDSATEIGGKMQIVLDLLKNLSLQNRNVKIKCYNGTPIFKILIFDDVMFVSSFVSPKNDQNAKMWRMMRAGNPLFVGLEKYFDELAKHCTECP